MALLYFFIVVVIVLLLREFLYWLLSVNRTHNKLDYIISKLNKQDEVFNEVKKLRQLLLDTE